MALFCITLKLISVLVYHFYLANHTIYKEIFEVAADPYFICSLRKHSICYEEFETNKLVYIYYISFLRQKTRSTNRLELCSFIIGDQVK